MLLASIEPIQAVHRHEPDQREVPDLADEVPGGPAGLWAGDVAPRDRQKVFRFDSGDIADMVVGPPTSQVPRAYSGR